MAYILVVDDEADIREIFELILKRSFSLDVVLAGSGSEAINVIRTRGVPKLVISDLNMADGDGIYLFTTMRESRWNVPFVICSTNAKDVKKRFPEMFGAIEKPDIIGPTIQLVDSILKQPAVQEVFAPIRISFLMRLGSTNYDLYMRLSDSNYVKVLIAGDAFVAADVERFASKNVEHLYLTTSDADSFIRAFEKNLLMVSQTATSTEDLTGITLASLETVERISRYLGWTSEVLEAARHAVGQALKTVSLEPALFKLFKQRLSNSGTRYAHHVSTLALLACAFCYRLGWVSDSTQMKLGLAALLHDLTVDDEIYEDILLWNQAAADLGDKTPEVVKYRNHPSEAANLVLGMKNLPPDVDQIILQHHEMKDGSGFPRGLNASRISPMAAVFIIVEDLINFTADAEDLKIRIQQFLKVKESKYNSGNFRKVFEAIREAATEA
jgi:response regulator RpfG family c-di-GMP phosphodiesterase